MEFESPNETDTANTDSEADEPVDEWWQTASLAGARAEFREALANAGDSLEDIGSPWLSYWVVANSRGLTRGAAKALALIIESAVKRGRPLEELAPPTTEMRLGFSRFYARALIALAEQPRIALGRLKRLEHELSAYAARVGTGEADAAAIRLAINAPLGRDPSPEDLRALRELWSRKQDESTKDADDTTSAAYCDAGLGQILVENLFLKKEPEDALVIARAAVETKPCGSTCALASQGLLRHCLEPLRDAGDDATAESWERKLASAAPPSHTWMAPAGARIRFLAKAGRPDEALQLIRDTEPFTHDSQTSAWQRFLFFRDSAEALVQLDEREESKCFRERANQLAFAFDQRNGNHAVSATLD